MEVIFIIIGYEMEDAQGTMLNSCQIEVYAKNSEEAIKKAKNYINKKFYKVRQIIEKK
jgi:hypothetical protein